MNLEELLKSIPGPLEIVGGSPLYDGSFGPYAISINGLRDGAWAAAINCSRKDEVRVKNWKRVIVPNPCNEPFPKRYFLPSGVDYMLPLNFPVGKQPTTCFSLLLIIKRLGLEAALFGVCGWASKWHDGDWEMHYIKTQMPNVTVHDPRPRW